MKSKILAHALDSLNLQKKNPLILNHDKLSVKTNVILNFQPQTEQARNLENEIGLLNNLPVAMKDNFNVLNTITTAGSSNHFFSNPLISLHN